MADELNLGEQNEQQGAPSYPDPVPAATPVAPEPAATSPAAEQDLTPVKFGEAADLDAAKAAAEANTPDNQTAAVRSNVFPGEDLTK